MLKKEKVDGYKASVKYDDVDWILTEDEMIIHIPFYQNPTMAKDVNTDKDVQKYRAAAEKAIAQNKELEKAANRTINMYKEGFENGVKEIEQLKEEKNKLEARVRELEKITEDKTHSEIDNWTDIIIHKQAIPAELRKNKKFMDLYDMPTYGELTKLSKTIRTFAEEQLLKAEQKLEDVATAMFNAAVNGNHSKDLELQKELVKQKTIVDIMEDILCVYELNK